MVSVDVGHMSDERSISAIQPFQEQKNNESWSRNGTVVRALASLQYGLGSIPGIGVICGLSLLLALVLAPRSYHCGFPELCSSGRFV